MATLPSFLLLIPLFSLLLLLPAATAQSAPAPEPPGPINISGILDRAGQYTTFMRMLAETHSDDQINNQVNNSRDGMTCFAPTDSAFQNLPAGTLNNLSDQQHVQLIQYHLLPKFYSMVDFQTVSNPVRTQAGGGPGQVFGLTITSRANQVNVSTGIVSVPVNNPIRSTRPLAVYQVDQVLLPKEFYEAPPPAEASPPAPSTNSTRRGSSGTPADGGAAAAPSTGNPNGAGKMSLGLGLVSGIAFSCLALLV